MPKSSQAVIAAKADSLTKEMARQLQEKEELEARRQRAEAGFNGNGSTSPLSDGLDVWVQCMRDAELARRLQEEEDRQSHRKESQVDFRAAQVAQDEEIARYMQRQERNNRRSHDLEPLERSQEDNDAAAPSSRKMEPLHTTRERLNSEGQHSPVDEDPPTSSSCTDLCPQPIRNIAEELDPTFIARKRESQMSSSPPSGVCLAPRTPHSVFYDYLPEPAFVPPTKRQGDKPGRNKAKEKRENCKQQ